MWGVVPSLAVATEGSDSEVAVASDSQVVVGVVAVGMAVAQQTTSSRATIHPPVPCQKTAREGPRNN